MDKKIKMLAKLLILTIVAVNGFFLVANPASAQYVVPTCNSATFNGHVEPNGSPTTTWFEWGPTSSLIYSTPRQTFNANSDFSQLIEGLSPSSVYYYRAMAQNSFGTSTGATISFSTSACDNNIPPPPPPQHPTVTISADQTNLSYNGSTTIRWNSTNATSCNASGGSNDWPGTRNLSGSFYTGNLTNGTTYNINCSNSSGSAGDSVTISVNNNNNNQQVSVSISADRTNINFNESTIIRWYPNNATSCYGSSGANGWSGTRNNFSDTFYTGQLGYTTTYTINCSNSNGGSDSESVTVYVGNNNNNNCNYNNNYYNNNYNYNNYQNCYSQLSVTTNNATNITDNSANLNGTLNNNNGAYTTAWFEYGTSTNYLGSSTQHNSYNSTFTNYNAYIGGLSPNTNYYFRAVAQSSQGLVYGSTLSFITTGNYNNNQPSVVLSADSTSVPFNGATTLRWYSNNATSCNASGGSNGWSGTKSIGPGSFYTGSLSSTRTYTMTCSNSFGSGTDSVTVTVRSQTVASSTPPTSLVLVNSSIDRNQPITPTVDNTRPRPGDEITYTVNYQNIGTGAITDLNLRITLPAEVDYMFSTPNNPSFFGNTLVFSLGTLGANKSGTVTVRAKVREDIPNGTSLDFPATLSYIDPSGQPQSVSANVVAQVISNPDNVVNLGANVFGAGFLPSNLFGWLLLIILIIVLVLLVKHLVSDQYGTRKTITLEEPMGHLGQKTTTTTIEH